MKRQVSILSLICVWTLLSCFCQNKNEAELPTSLKGTKWKLAGIVDDETGVLQVLEPKECEECYTLTFDTDSTATVLSINITLKLDLLHFPPEVFINFMLWGERYDKDGAVYYDSQIFRDAIRLADSYMLSPKELKLFGRYGNCLSFKPF